jgi:hypothetical protein
MERTIIVLGMHRSGTSCLAGILEKAGVFFGAVSRENRHTDQGDFENPRVMGLHDELLEHCGGSWDRPPPEVRWPRRLQGERDRIIARYGHPPLWGFKDPRTLLALEGWSAAPPEAVWVAAFRHPLAVARSLERRNGIPPAQGLDLRMRYNRRLLGLLERKGLPVHSFDLEPDADRQQAARLLRSLGLPAEAAGGGFFDPGLRHSAAADGELPLETAALFRRLQDAAP